MKLKPYLLLFILLIILTFILGTRYGQKVEKTNKAVSYILSLTPVKNPTPTYQPLQFKSYSNDSCGVQFIYPETLTKTEETTDSAKFSDDFDSNIDLSCNPKKISSILDEKNIATEEIKFQNKKIMAKTKEKNLIFQLKNSLNGKVINLQISKNLLPLFETSLKYNSQ